MPDTTNSSVINFNNLIKLGERLTPIQIRNIRLKYNMTQAKFADLLDVKYYTYTRWEQGNRYPSSPGHALLKIADEYPDIFFENRREIIASILKYFKM